MRRWTGDWKPYPWLGRDSLKAPTAAYSYLTSEVRVTGAHDRTPALDENELRGFLENFERISSSGSRRPSSLPGRRQGGAPHRTNDLGPVRGRLVALVVPDEVIRGGISEEGRGSGRSPEIFRSCDSQAGRPGRCRPEVASRPGPGQGPGKGVDVSGMRHSADKRRSCGR